MRAKTNPTNEAVKRVSSVSETPSPRSRGRWVEENPEASRMKHGEANMANGLKIGLMAGILWLGIGAAHAEPCFMRDVNGTPVSDCTNTLPFALPTGGPGELRVEGHAVAGQGFGSQAAGTAVQREVPAAAGNGWSGWPGEFGLHGPERVRQGKQLPVVAPAKPTAN